VTLDHLAEKRLEAPLVHVVLVNLLALVTLADDVVERAGKCARGRRGIKDFQHRKISISK
jgi:hypothetical protein